MDAERPDQPDAEPVIADTLVITAAAAAVIERRLDEMRSRGETISHEEAYWLGVQACAEAIRQSGKPAGQETKTVPAATYPEHGREEQPEPRRASWKEVTVFARQHRKNSAERMLGYIETRMVRENLRDPDDPIAPVVDDLWPEDQADSEDIDNEPILKWPDINLDAAESILRELLKNRGYPREMKQPSFKNLGVISLSMLAEFVNAKLQLPDDERIPTQKDYDNAFLERWEQRHRR
jgi:hypothetical protein